MTAAALRRLALATALLAALPAGAQQRDQSSLIYELLDRINQLEDEVRQLRGDVEMLRYRQEQGAHAQPAPAAPPVASTRPAPPPAPAAPDAPPPPAAGPGNERAAFDEAINYLRAGRFDQAAPALDEFVSRYPSSPLTPSAAYWLGEARYALRDYGGARDAFLKFGASYPTSDKLPDAMLKLGFSYQELGDPSRAREVLQRLTQAYPGTSAAQQAQARLQQMR